MIMFLKESGWRKAPTNHLKSDSLNEQDMVQRLQGMGPEPGARQRTTGRGVWGGLWASEVTAPPAWPRPPSERRKYHPAPLQARSPTRPLDPIRDKPQLRHPYYWWCSLPRSPTSRATLSGHGQQGLWWFCSPQVLILKSVLWRV